MKLTRQQRVALKSVYDRRPMYVQAPITNREGYTGRRKSLIYPVIGGAAAYHAERSLARATYRQFRRTAQMGYGCIMVPWCNMWLGIETDGYIHS